MIILKVFFVWSLNFNNHWTDIALNFRKAYIGLRMVLGYFTGLSYPFE